MSVVTTCHEFSPSNGWAAKCVCNYHWNQHTVPARDRFMKNAEKDLISAMISACKRDNETQCKGYWPSATWERGTAAPDCTCGRPNRAHTPGEVLKGIRAHREKYGLPQTTKKDPCGQFYGTITTPGNCGVCNLKWVEHPVKARSLAIEAFSDLHEPACKSVTMNGDVECNCMTDEEKQLALDKLGGVKEEKVPCKKFKSKSSGHTHCITCGEPFYNHSREACGGFTRFIEWRAANLTNEELAEWFQSLPGKDRQERTRTLEKLLADPNYKFYPPPNMVNPSSTIMLGMLEALDGGAAHRVKPKADSADQIVEAIVIHREDTKVDEQVEEERLYLCHYCTEMLAKVPGSACDGCAEFIAAHNAVHGVTVRSKDATS